PCADACCCQKAGKTRIIIERHKARCDCSNNGFRNWQFQCRIIRKVGATVSFSIRRRAERLTSYVLKKNINRIIGAIIKLTPESNDYNIFETYGKDTSLVTTQTAFKIADIGYDVKAGQSVASVMTESFKKIQNRVESDNAMASEL
ncbi:MAG: hypothetical protein EZS28_027192, partial [Streblomastix strix]